MTHPNDLSSPLTDAEYHELNSFLRGLDFDGAILNVSELDGFFTAVVSGPEMIVPSKWLEVIWGDKANSPVWDSQEEFQQVFSLLMRHMNSTADTLMDNPMAFEPCFMQRTVKGATYTIVDEWCTGYMKGVALCPDGWGEMARAAADLLAPMLMFTTETGCEQLDGMEQQEIEYWQAQIEPAARRIHAYWLAQRSMGSAPQFHPSMFPAAANDEPFVRATPKVGRNDPCPCGSGKKYKKCCGLH